MKFLSAKVTLEHRNHIEQFPLGSFQTQMVSQVVENQPRHFSAIQNILAYGDLGAIRKDCDVVHMVCDAVSRRAAFMCAAGISAIARKIHANRPDEYLDITCGVDGSVYKVSFSPEFSKVETPL